MNLVGAFYGGPVAGESFNLENVAEPPLELVFCAAVDEGALETTYRLESVWKPCSDFGLAAYVFEARR